ncbi:hypothetical protein E2C01_028391 [Portunus trituberculatus]|uniref:Uncharacterized protein n=1 Tax=Portunus trituberculatus TaxID=210409 RepID=A0A5B7ENI4_PORTR|nr:hypothetical protein [Portunus trituberculatus]
MAGNEAMTHISTQWTKNADSFLVSLTKTPPLPERLDLGVHGGFLHCEARSGAAAANGGSACRHVTASGVRRCQVLRGGSVFVTVAPRACLCLCGSTPLALGREGVGQRAEGGTGAGVVRKSGVRQGAVNHVIHFFNDQTDLPPRTPPSFPPSARSCRSPPARWRLSPRGGRAGLCQAGRPAAALVLLLLARPGRCCLGHGQNRRCAPLCYRRHTLPPRQALFVFTGEYSCWWRLKPH